MKLVHPDQTFQIKFTEGYVQKLIVEAPRLMSEFVMDFKEQIEGRAGKWVLSHCGEILKFADVCELIVNIFDLDINQKKILSVLYEELAREVSDTELVVQWREAASQVEMVLNRAIDEIGYEIDYTELDLKPLFKAMEIRLKACADGYVEYLLEYLQLVSQVKKTKIFVLVNLTSFLTEEEMRYLYEQARYEKYYLLLLDVKNVEVDKYLERTVIVDKDYCVIDMRME